MCELILNQCYIYMLHANILQASFKLKGIWPWAFTNDELEAETIQP